MPKRYMGIKSSVRAENPDMPLSQVKTHAAKIYEATRKPHEIHLATVQAQERRRRTR